MIVSCEGCAKRYRFDDAKLAGRPSVALRCPNCHASITITATSGPPGPSVGDQTQRLSADADLIPQSAPVRGGDLVLPSGRRLSLAVLEGNDSGRIFPIDRPRVVIGRGEADIVINDPEISRQHSAIEVHGARIVLKDLGSTNGTFINEVKTTQAEIDNRAEFRIGGTRLMLIVTETQGDLEPVE
ncbi:MAG TPA: FHA domain-containing protein [Candidatus Polarisedimenticolia bacterium]|nr:FHA domain-containing protein [Candidatus Polarisedimenticolia bacterium]